MHSSRRRSKRTGNCVSAGYTWSIYIGLWSTSVVFLILDHMLKLLVNTSLFITAMPTCVLEFKHYITYIRSCFIHFSPCSQQPLHSFIVTLLTRHIQCSCFVLLRSEGTKLKNIHVSRTETRGGGGGGDWKSYYSSIHGDNWWQPFHVWWKWMTPPPPFLRFWYNHLRVHYSNLQETTGLVKDGKRDGTTHKYSSLQINHVCTHVCIAAIN